MVKHTNIARFLKYIWSLLNIMHEWVNRNFKKENTNFSNVGFDEINGGWII